MNTLHTFIGEDDPRFSITQGISQKGTLMTDIVSKANQATPPDVVVPHSAAGVIIWALGQYGPQVVIPIACLVASGYFMNIMYKDNVELTKQALSTSVIQSEAQIKMAVSLDRQSTSMDSLTAEIRRAHAPDPPK